MSAITSVKTVTEYFTKNTFMHVEDKIKAIQLNINFIEAYPEFFDDVMRGPTDIFFGQVVLAKAQALKTCNTLEYYVDQYGQDAVDNLYFPDAFEELAAQWELLRAQRATVIPFVPIEMFKCVNENTFQPKIGFKTRFGVIEVPKH